MDLPTSARDFYSNVPSISQISLSQLSKNIQNVFVMLLLMGKVLEWATAVWDNDNQVQSSYSYFAQPIEEVSECAAEGRDISVQLLH